MEKSVVELANDFQRVCDYESTQVHSGHNVPKVHDPIDFMNCSITLAAMG